MKSLPFVAAVTLFFCNIALADINKSVVDLCEKMKSCATEEVERQGLEPEMKEMMLAMLEATCATQIAPYAAVIGQAGLEDKAEACVDTVMAQSCESLMQNEEGFTSDACTEFEKAAEAAGIDMDSPPQPAR